MISELQKDKLQIILKDEILLKTIEEVFNQTIEEFLPIIDNTNDNAVLGEKYRAYETAKKIIQRGFIDLLSFKSYPKDKASFNKER